MAQVTVRTTGRAAGAQALAGGIAGEAADDSRIIDCQVRTGDNSCLLYTSSVAFATQRSRVRIPLSP